MKYLIRLVLILLLSIVVSDLRGTNSAPATPESPFAPIAFLAGGVWRGKLPPPPQGGELSIELKADWAANHQGIRFDGTFIADGKRSPYTSGIYGWDAARKQIVFLYSDAEGSLTEGAIAVENGALVHRFNVTHVDGKIEKAQATITPTGPDTYTNDIFVEKDGIWKKVVSVTYNRTTN
jgi:hypothetical protein